MDIILKIAGCIIIMAISFAVSRFLTVPYCAVEKFTGWITYPFEALIMLFSMLIGKVKNLINKKPAEEKATGNWGGKKTVWFIIAIAVISVVLFGVVIFTKADLQTFFEEEVLLNLPGLYYIGLLFSYANGESVLALDSILEMSLISFMQIAFFRKIKDDIEILPKIVYNTVFYIFSTALAFVVPAEVFMVPLNVIKGLPALFDKITTMQINENPIGGILMILLMILYFGLLIFALHALVSCVCIAIREFCASITFSLPAFGIIVAVIIIFMNFFNINSIFAYIVLTTLAVAGVVFTEFWREYAIEEHNPFY